jgi:hypothetical protein
MCPRLLTLIVKTIKIFNRSSRNYNVRSEGITFSIGKTIMTGEENRRGWAAIIFASGVADVVGAVRGSARLHWTQRAARQEAEAWASEMGLGQIEWESLDEQVVIGRTPKHAVVVRSILLPLGSPEEEML